MAKYTVEIADGCISCGQCEATCPEVFKVEGKSKVLKPELDDIGCAKDAAEGCPVNVIHITDNEKKEKII